MPSISAPTPTSISTREKAGLLTVRIFGVYNAEPGAAIYATPDPGKTYRFGADGKVIGRHNPEPKVRIAKVADFRTRSCLK